MRFRASGLGVRVQGLGHFAGMRFFQGLGFEIWVSGRIKAVSCGKLT